MTLRLAPPSLLSVCVLVLASAACSDDAARFEDTAGAPSGGGSGGSSAGSGGAASSAGTTSNGGKPSAGAASMGGASAGTAGTAGSGPKGGSATVVCDTPPSAAPEMKWVNATGNLAGMESECGNLGLVSAQPCSNRVIAGVAQKGLWATQDGGKSWQALGTGAGSDEITNRISAIVYDPRDPKIFWESGIYNGGCVYKTTDSGTTFEQLGEISHCDSVSVDLSDPERKTLIAGGHETNNPLHKSTDGGQTWSNIAAGLPDGFCTATQVIDAMNFLVGCNSGSIMRTTTGGSAWEKAAGSQGGTFQPLVAADGTIYWPGSNGGVSKSEDQGKTFTSVADANTAPSIIAPAQFAELPDGRIVINGQDHLLASSDKGKTWQPIGVALPFPGGGFEGSHGLAYSAQTKTFFVWHWDCSNNVPDDAIMSMGFDWQTQ
jgi:photosystem II stability/assembly factor-like uncharacterized protein